MLEEEKCWLEILWTSLGGVASVCCTAAEHGQRVSFLRLASRAEAIKQDWRHGAWRGLDRHKLTRYPRIMIMVGCDPLKFSIAFL